MKELGIELTLNDVELMIKEADQDGDGKINYKGTENLLCICYWWWRWGSLRQAFAGCFEGFID